jgi:hypothetical protein
LIDDLSIVAGDNREKIEVVPLADLESINLRGTSDFPIGRFMHHLLPGVAVLNAKQRRLA